MPAQGIMEKQRPGSASTLPAWPTLDWRIDMEDRTCSVEGCAKQRHMSGPLYCQMHYRRWRLTGDPGEATPRAIYGTVEKRFWPKVNKDGPVPEKRPDLGPCWLWTACTHQGYGLFNQGIGKTPMAHRIAYELLVGPIPDDKELDHLCRNTTCVRPSHLEAVTHHVNIQRGEAGKHYADRTHCVNGHPFDEVNTRRYLRNGTWRRVCRECQRRARRASDAKRYLALRADRPGVNL